MYSLLSLSWSTIAILSAASLLTYELGWIIYCRTFHPLAKIPGPFLASVSRIWIWRTVRSGRTEQVQIQLHRKYGDFVRIAPNEIACSSPSAIRDLYRNQRPLEKTDFYTTWTNASFGKHPDNFSVTSEKVHSERRRIVNHVYSLSNVLKSESYIDNCSRLFITQLSEFADSGRTIDLGQWLQMYAFDVIGELYFGRMFGFMKSGTDYQSYIQSLDTLNPVLAAVAVSATYARPFLLMSAVVSSSVRQALKAIDHITNAAKSSVTKRQEELAAIQDGGQSLRRDLLQQLFEIMVEKGEKVDFGIPQIQYESYVALFAGSDTTAIAMRSVFYHLSHSPMALATLLEEIGTAFPPSTYSQDSPISYADATKLPFLCATIKEAMRLHPSVGFTMPRVSPTPEGLHICDTHIPPGYRVGINAHVVQRDKSVFGEDANVFKPQRWLEGENDPEKLREMDRCMLNFGGGTRTCIGKNISLSELHKLIPYVLRNFELIAVDVDQQWVTHNYWFNKQTGLHYRLKRRVA